MKITSHSKLIVWVSIFLVLFDNIKFFRNVAEVYPLTSALNIAFVASLAVVLTAVLVIVLTLLSSRYIIKPLIITLLIVTSLTNYFMNTYHVVIDDSMIQNMFQTNMDESLDLLSLQLIAYLTVLGIIPSFLVYKTPLRYISFKKEFVAKLKTAGMALAVMAAMLFSFNKYYTSFFREHKPLRYYTNPTYYLHSLGKYAGNTMSSKGELHVIGSDAKVVQDIDHVDSFRKLVIVVVGEAARADRFSLNGYERETNPLLKKEDIVNLSNVSSCGTSTAVSVPCMFSILGKDEYSHAKGIDTENVLDVLNHTNEIAILWRDNNSNSKGVAVRVPYEDYRTSENNTMCDDECRDEGMLVGLDEYVAQHENEDILIVLHQMGNHGPAYYKRYPKEFEKFTPVCETNQLEACTQEEISNAYDNAILYTDYFLSKVINLLKQHTDTRETAMIYMSDHGESLGENGLYLHGLPYFMAPETQTHVAALMWFDGGDLKEDVNEAALRANSHLSYSHDYLFHTLIDIFEVNTSAYDANLVLTK